MKFNFITKFLFMIFKFDTNKEFLVQKINKYLFLYKKKIKIF